MLSSLSFEKNKRSILQSCSAYIYHWSASSTEPHIEPVLRHITRYLDINKDLVSALKDTDADYRIYIFKIIAIVTFDMIASRAFTGRVYSGLKDMHKEALDELLYPGYISQQEYDEDKITLQSICEERIPQIYKDLYFNKNRN